jgi:hypothetical protein
MLAATKGDQPQWFRAPATVTSTNICRLSGKLATNSCRDAQAFDAEGNLVARSTVYTEYFVRGTEPHEYCPLHGAYAGSYATLATSGMEPAPPAAQAAAPAAPPLVTGGTLPPQVQQPPEPKPESEAAPQRRRGFWGRIFGGREQRAPAPPPSSQPQPSSQP